VELRIHKNGKEFVSLCLRRFWLRTTNLRSLNAHCSPASHLAKSLNAELGAVSVQEVLPPYAGYIDAKIPGGTILLRESAAEYYRDLQTRAQRPLSGKA
jgi:hypothetical protein